MEKEIIMEQEIDQKDEKSFQNKKVYLNYIRIIAAFFVIGVHVCSPFLRNSELNSTSYIINTIFNCIVRVGVPLYVMISGALFLDENKKISIKKLLLHNVLRLIVIFFAWAYLYNVVDIMASKGFEWKYFVDAFVKMSQGDFKYHLWYLPMLIGLYLITPVLRFLCRVENKKTVEYFLVLFLIVTCVLNFLSTLNFGVVVNTIFDAVMQIDPYVIINYIGVYVLGWYLSKFDLSIKFRKNIYIIGFLVYLLAPAFTILYSNILNSKISIMANTGIINILASSAIFVFFRYSKVFNKENKLFALISKCTFGIYLVHPFIRNIVFALFGSGYDALCITGWGFVLIPVYISVIFIISLLISLIVNLIPKKISRWIM